MFLITAVLFLFMQMPAYSYVIGVSPASRQICVAPGYNVSTYVAPSTNSNIKVLVVISAESDLFELGENVWISNADDMKIPIILHISEDQEEGLYESFIFVCTEQPDKDDIVVRSCVASKLDLNISSECTMNFINYIPEKIPEDSTNDEQSLLPIILITLVILLGLGYLIQRKIIKGFY